MIFFIDEIFLSCLFVNPNADIIIQVLQHAENLLPWVAGRRRISTRFMIYVPTSTTCKEPYRRMSETWFLFWEDRCCFQIVTFIQHCRLSLFHWYYSVVYSSEARRITACLISPLPRNISWGLHGCHESDGRRIRRHVMVAIGDGRRPVRDHCCNVSNKHVNCGSKCTARVTFLPPYFFLDI